MQATPENIPEEFRDTGRLSYESNLSAFLDQRDKAAAVLRAQSRAEHGRTPRSLENSLNELSKCSDIRSLLDSRNNIAFLPLLGAIKREDLDSIQKQSTFLIEDYNGLRKWHPFSLSYGKVVFFTAISINLFINYYIYPRLGLFTENDRTGQGNQVGINNMLAQNIVVSLICIGLIFLFWQGIVYFRDEIFCRLSRLPFVGSLFSGNRYMLNSASRFAYIIAELVEAGMPISDALRCGGLDRSSDANVSRSIARTLRFQSSSSAAESHQTNHLRTLGDIYSYNRLIRHRKSELYATSSTIAVGFVVYWTAASLFAPLAKVISLLS